MVRKVFSPSAALFTPDLQGKGFPVFKSARVRRGFGLHGHGVISSFFSNILLPFVRKKIAPIALKAAGKTVTDVLLKKKPVRKVLKKRLNTAGRQILKATISSKKQKKGKKPAQKRDIFTNL